MLPGEIFFFLLYIFIAFYSVKTYNILINNVYTFRDKDDMSDINSAAFSRYFPYINAVTGRYFAIVFLNSYDVSITEEVQITLFSFTISCTDGRT